MGHGIQVDLQYRLVYLLGEPPVYFLELEYPRSFDQDRLIPEMQVMKVFFKMVHRELKYRLPREALADTGTMRPYTAANAHETVDLYLRAGEGHDGVQGVIVNAPLRGR